MTVWLMTDGQLPVSEGVNSIGDAIARMQQIDATLPAADGDGLLQPDVLGRHPTGRGPLSGVFLRSSLHGIASTSSSPTSISPPSTRPTHRSGNLRRLAAIGRSRVPTPNIYPVQFALGRHERPHQPRPADRRRPDLHPISVTPDQRGIHDDYQKVDTLLDAAEQAVRQSFESSAVQV